MIFTPKEILDIFIMAAGIGFIFMGVFGNRPKKHKAGKAMPLVPKAKGMFDWEEFKYAALAIAPAVILHEMAHKFTGMAFGLDAVFQASYFWLVIGIALKMLNFGFIFFIPGYVSFANIGEPLQMSLTAFAGPAVHLMIFVASVIVLKKAKLSATSKYFWMIQRKINMWLFFLNMIPIRPFDGFSVFNNLRIALF